MLNANDRIELLINRKLDGELTSDERLELDRALIRSPQHREMLEQCERIDAACAEVIESACDAPFVLSSDAVSDRSDRSMVGGWRRRLLWLVPGALAACLTGMVVLDQSTPASTPGDLQLVAGGSEAVSPEAMDVPAVNQPVDLTVPANDRRQAEAIPAGWLPGGIMQASTHPQITSRLHDTQYLTVIGKDQTIFVIELDRTQTLRQPKRRERVRLTNNDL
jgi:hypothetical protein